MFEKGSKLECIGEYAFYGCHGLRHIALPDGLAIIGKKTFKKNGLEEITLPGTLKEIGEGVLDCESLKTVYVGDGCDVDLSNTGVPSHTNVCPSLETFAGGVKVWNLRA